LRKVEQRQKRDEGGGAGTNEIKGRGGGKEVEQGRAGGEETKGGGAETGKLKEVPTGTEETKERRKTAAGIGRAAGKKEGSKQQEKEEGSEQQQQLAGTCRQLPPICFSLIKQTLVKRYLAVFAGVNTDTRLVQVDKDPVSV
jgi:hypothetical protein